MRVVAVSTSARKGEKKVNLPQGELLANFGLAGDAHADGSHRQLSLLALESIARMQALGAQVAPGDFAENITTEGVELHKLPVGSKIAIGNEILLEVTQIGKTCHQGCAIQKQVGSCVMPREGIFCRVLRGGIARPDDEIRVYPEAKTQNTANVS